MASSEMAMPLDELIAEDGEEGKKYIPFNKKLSFTGWEKIELTPNTVLFPATLEGIYFSRANQDAPLNSEVYIDNLSAVYVQKK